jgi:hypothetical protein
VNSEQPSQFGLRTVLSIFLLFWGTCLLISKAPLPASPFVAGGSHYRDFANFASGDEWSAVKLFHAQQMPRFDVGLFGNSRIVMVSTESLGREDGSVFNFSIGGHGFRHSVYLAEKLAALGKLPKTVVVSFDHVVLDFAGLPILYMNLFDGLVGIGRDFVGLFKSADTRKSDINSQFHAPIRRVTAQAGRIFNLEHLERRLRLLYKAYFGSAPRSDASIRRPDGSLNSLKKNRPVDGARLELTPNLRSTSVRYPLLEDDLQRLAVAARRSGSKVVVYESPINPAVVDQIEDGLDQAAREIRRRFLATCKAVGIACFSAPVFPLKSGGVHWTDLFHPPREFIGPWIASVIGD